MDKSDMKKLILAYSAIAEALRDELGVSADEVNVSVGDIEPLSLADLNMLASYVTGVSPEVSDD